MTTGSGASGCGSVLGVNSGEGLGLGVSVMGQFNSKGWTIVLGATLLAGPTLDSDTPVLAAGNDTDAVFAPGLFPLGRQNPPLSILSETVSVSLGPDDVTTSRVYWLRNQGPSGAVQLATICGTNLPSSQWRSQRGDLLGSRRLPSSKKTVLLHLPVAAPIFHRREADSRHV